MPRFFLLTLLAARLIHGQTPLPVKWEELTGPDFIEAIHRSQGTCILPTGILEKHGAHLPIGTDVFHAQYGALQAAQKEYAVVFPVDYFGQILDARHEPGTFAIPAPLALELIKAITDEMARNGCKKIMIVNGHGGNPPLLTLFSQSLLEQPHDYVVYVFTGGMVNEKPGPFPRTSAAGHGGDRETGWVLVSRPELVHMERATSQSGEDWNRQSLPPHLSNNLNEFANFPEHYSGDGSKGSKALGEWDMNNWVDQILVALRWVKADTATPKLQAEYFQMASHPLDTKQPIGKPK
jgi:creatinine amidohydrolase